MKEIAQVLESRGRHWVGDGFPVRSLFSYADDAAALSPFLLLDYAGPHVFEPAATPRGVGEHPHRGFETVTLVYEGEVAHRDSAGGGGVIGPGDVQWMTAGSGILHEEMHSPGFTRTGGPFAMVQLWVNLEARHKSSPPAYQALASASIPSVELPGGAGSVRVVAGSFAGTEGPARTFGPLNLWEARLEADAAITLDLPEGHTTLLVVLAGHVTLNDELGAGEAVVIRLSRAGRSVAVRADGESLLLVLTGEPIDEPVVGHGPFVMTSEAEIRAAIADFQSGRFGQMPR